MPAAGDSDASARTCVTSRWRSLWPLPSPRTIAHSARRRQGPGREARDALHGHVPEAPLPQGRVLRHVVGYLPVPALDVPVPQMVDQLPDIEQFFRALSPVLSRLLKCPRSCPMMSLCARRACYAAGGTAGGSADDLIPFLVTADCGALRRHSSSWWWWRTKFWSSRLFLWTAFNSVAFLQETHF